MNYEVGSRCLPPKQISQDLAGSVLRDDGISDEEDSGFEPQSQ